MKLRVLALIGTMILTVGLSGQATLTDVINEFNTGVEKLNNQEYENSIEHFNQVISLAEAVGDSALEMKANAEKQIPAAYYRQATVFMKRKQYDNAIPYLEKTVETAAHYGNNEEIAGKAGKYLPQLYLREGLKNTSGQNYEAALENFDKALALNENLYKAHHGKGMVFQAQDELDMMMEEYKLAKAGAEAKGDTKTIDQIDAAVNKYYNKIVQEEFEAVDPEEADYSYLIEAAENALEANPKNGRPYYYLAAAYNKMVEYDKAIENALKGVLYEKEAIWLSAINLELGTAYQNTVEYDKACETFKKVLEEPFASRAKKKMGNVPDCN